ncbi:MAG: nicotinamide-nucleotide amidohydrolase family protein [Turneriella sp.]|nr:nicotinamide-nucleotide amidohydrolase family protein [Turneriella sp.]
MGKGVRLCITGSEVMNGFVLDKNTQFFASELYALGYELKESRVIHDDREQILRTWKEYRETGDIIVNSGGLGPTTDDLTVDLLCEWLGDTPVYEKHAEKRTRYFFERRARDQTRAISIETALRQARIPSRAQAIKNTVGLAPGIFIPEIPFIALPGFPDEIKSMWAETLGLIEAQGVERAATQIIPIWGVGESQLFSHLPEAPDITYGVHALPWGCRLFLRTAAGNGARLAELTAVIQAKFPGQSVADPLKEIVAHLKAEKLSLAVAESCTGGLAAKQITDLPGVSTVFKGGVVTYANEAKEALVGVDPEILRRHGAVSRECAAAMAEGAARALAADIAISFTGIAGPDGGSEAKPVGTVFIGMHDARSGITRVGKFLFPFGRERFRNASVACAFLAAWQFLHRDVPTVWPLSHYEAVSKKLI